MGLNGLEPSTSRLSGVRSNLLSYKPILRLNTLASCPFNLYLIDNFLSIYFFIESGSHLFSRAVSRQVSSAAYVLTFVFGMGTGVSHKRITTGNV